MNFEIFIPQSLAVWGFMTLVFALAVRFRDNSIVDIAWGVGFGMVALLSLFLSGDYHLKQVLVTVLVLIWGLRLAGYIALRKNGKPEDFRYKKWREEWGKFFVLRSYFQIYVLQGILMLLISAMVVFVNFEAQSGFVWNDFLGLALWIFGFYFETVGDYQMYKFKSDAANKGKIFKSGLWAYTRHPNYFGETVMWWGIFIIALGLSGGIYFIFSPLIITFLLLKVSGVTMLEKKYEGDEEYQEYIKNTSAFVPRFKK